MVFELTSSSPCSDPASASGSRGHSSAEREHRESPAFESSPCAKPKPPIPGASRTNPIRPCHHPPVAKRAVVHPATARRLRSKPQRHSPRQDPARIAPAVPPTLQDQRLANRARANRRARPLGTRSSRVRAGSLRQWTRRHRSSPVLGRAPGFPRSADRPGSVRILRILRSKNRQKTPLMTTALRTRPPLPGNTLI